MESVGGLGKIMMGFGLMLFGLGALFFFAGKIPGLGRLPGDILIKKENMTFFFPLATSLLISLLLTIVLNVFQRK